MMSKRLALPVDQIISELQTKVRQGSRQIIIRASPGSGKTTRIPPALLSCLSGQIWVLEPRRLAAKMAALRVSEEMELGTNSLVGWQMRFDSMLNNETRILFLTEGMFPVRLAESPDLQKVSCIVLDEFHERHAQTDIAFALTRFLQTSSRPDLVLIVMSATLDVTKLQDRMPEAHVIDIETPVHPVETIWWRGDPQLPLIEKMRSGVTSVVDDRRHAGHILGFLPGTADIVRAAESLRKAVPSDTWDVLELRASLDRRDQEWVFAETGKRKIILATNIAESSITIPGVTGVVDCGLARVPSFNRSNLVTTLETRPVSQASLIQRAGRAGRTAPGVVLRLYSPNDFAGRPSIDIPELLRSDLSPILMMLLNLKKTAKLDWDVSELPWLDPPPVESWQDAKKFLKMLGLIDANEQLLDARAATLPTHPRLARLLIAAEAQQLTIEGCWLAAILSEDSGVLDQGTLAHADALGCDLLAQYDLVTRNQNQPRFANIARTARQLQRSLIKGSSHTTPKATTFLDLSSLLITAFPDRVAKARKAYSPGPFREYTLCTGGDVRLPLTSAAAHHDWIIALELTSSRSIGSVQTQTKTSLAPTSGNNIVAITRASGIEKNQVTLANGDWLQDKLEFIWDDATERVRSIDQVTYGILMVEEIRKSPLPGPEVSKLLEAKLRERWPKPFDDESALISFVTRQKLLLQHGLAEHAWDLDELRTLLISHLADDATSFSRVKEKNLGQWLRECIGESEYQAVEAWAPSEIKVGAGFHVPIHYELGIAPWIGARLQIFFGEMETPKLLKGRLALTVHLWAPNQMALQVTTDLASFWRNAYPAIRSEYMRKYPRHYWPENPENAEPPVRGSLKPRS